MGRMFMSLTRSHVIPASSERYVPCAASSACSMMALRTLGFDAEMARPMRPLSPAEPLVRGDVQDVGVGGVHDHVHGAGVLIDVEDLVPALTAVGGAVHAPVLGGRP